MRPSRWILLILCIVTAALVAFFFLAISGIGIAIHDTVYVTVPKEVGVGVCSELAFKIIDVIIPFMLLPIITLLLWILVTVPLILVLSHKKINSIEQAAPSNR
jgi:hypothetical protein